jgi:hypothetical protein
VLVVIGVTFAFWLCARLLKKTKVLRAD